MKLIFPTFLFLTGCFIPTENKNIIGSCYRHTNESTLAKVISVEKKLDSKFEIVHYEFVDETESSIKSRPLNDKLGSGLYGDVSGFFLKYDKSPISCDEFEEKKTRLQIAELSDKVESISRRLEYLEEKK